MTEKSEQNHVQHECLMALTKDEVMERACELADRLEDCSKKEEKFRAEAKAARAELKSLRIRIDELAEAIRTKKEYRDIDCFEVPDFDREVVEIFRSDTGERVHARPVTAQDRQMGI
jgi:uncharacterized coiled-coil DUF342 family protein